MTPRQFAALTDRLRLAERRADTRAAVVAATIANTVRDPRKRPRPYGVDDFLTTAAKVRAAPQSVDEQATILQGLVTRWAGASGNSNNGNGTSAEAEAVNLNG